eukprot:m.66296 g.66296  ORF g.66296 m.66296 type:complete len:52 (-) comp15935_c0_seq8:372-527(-)
MPSLSNSPFFDQDSAGVHFYQFIICYIPHLNPGILIVHIAVCVRSTSARNI